MKRLAGDVAGACESRFQAFRTGIGVSTFWKRQVKEGTITSGAYMNTGFTSSIQTHLGAMGATMTIGLSQGTTRHWDLVLECFPIDPTV